VAVSEQTDTFHDTRTAMTLHDIRPNRSRRLATRTATERRILVALSHPSDRRSIELALDRIGLVVRSTADEATTSAMLTSYRPDVVVIDAREVYPAVTPLAGRLRELPHVGVVVMGGNNREQRLAALHFGADDVVATDTAADEIALRCTNIASRVACGEVDVSPTVEASRTFGPVVVDFNRREIHVNGHLVPSTKLEFDLFARICRTPDQVVTRVELIESVWGPNWFGDSHVVDVHLSNLRRKLRQRCAAVDYWYTVRGVGFRLSDDLTARTDERVESLVRRAG
jgi:two-component system OmpR family response regulator